VPLRGRAPRVGRVARCGDPAIRAGAGGRRDAAHHARGRGARRGVTCWRPPWLAASPDIIVTPGRYARDWPGRGAGPRAGGTARADPPAVCRTEREGWRRVGRAGGHLRPRRPSRTKCSPGVGPCRARTAASRPGGPHVHDAAPLREIIEAAFFDQGPGRRPVLARDFAWRLPRRFRVHCRDGPGRAGGRPPAAEAQNTPAQLPGLGRAARGGRAPTAPR